jgi:hypothetical protein
MSSRCALSRLHVILPLIEGMGAMKMVQVAVRRWRNGKVVHERFYHKYELDRSC